MEITYKKEYQYIIAEETKKTTLTSEIYKAYDKLLNNRAVAIKCVKLSENKNKQEVVLAKQEIAAMLTVREHCENVPMVYDYYYDDEKNLFYIIMEWVEGVTLSDIIHDQDVNEIEFIDYIIEIVNILCIMQRQGIYHKDIKPGNIMIRNYRKFNQKTYLIDFNISLHRLNPIEGTPLYCAPEIGTKLHHTKRDKVDMYAIGVILYEYYLGRIPQPGSEYYSSIDADKTWSMYKRPCDIETARPVSNVMSDIIEKCMKYHPADRYNDNNELLLNLKKYRKELRKKK